MACMPALIKSVQTTTPTSSGSCRTLAVHTSTQKTAKQGVFSASRTALTLSTITGIQKRALVEFSAVLRMDALCRTKRGVHAVVHATSCVCVHTRHLSLALSPTFFSFSLSLSLLTAHRTSHTTHHTPHTAHRTTNMHRLPGHWNNSTAASGTSGVYPGFGAPNGAWVDVELSVTRAAAATYSLSIRMGEVSYNYTNTWNATYAGDMPQAIDALGIWFPNSRDYSYVELAAATAIAAEAV